MKNLILNGNFTAGPAAGGIAVAGTDTILAAGWLYSYANAEAATGPAIGQSALSNTELGDSFSPFCLTIDASGNQGSPPAGDLFRLTQRISNMLRRKSARYHSLSFSAKAANPYPIGISINGNYGTGGSPSATVRILSQQVNITTSWQRYVVGFYVPAATASVTFGTNLDDYAEINFWLQAGSDSSVEAGGIRQIDPLGAFQITNIQLEAGQPTAFDDGAQKDAAENW